MKLLPLFLAVLSVTVIDVRAQNTTTVLRLSPGVYSVTSSSGTQIVTVVPTGTGSYSFSSSGATSTVLNLAPGMYQITTSGGTSLGSSYINPVGNGTYSLSSPPLAAAYITPGASNNAGMYNAIILAAMLRQQCIANGNVMYKAHWYSPVKCETRGKVEYEEQKKADKRRK